ncbi:hypothetical protein QJS04_geneDACA018339 [Acorus gramineus]|uniref:Uncharacterized protein n=1 Tax=Acorus gramineus TaxID=55184 RepID=A0AAV9B928_ACOGR|nr:hypothetical protein QJS04_geneDACA023302 [Acorus gramineus]KAK1274049.1 hypothetical protein QJS04_geneDACA018339 [Acorus gramineus]
MGENFIDITLQKLKEDLLFLCNLGGYALKKIDDVFPPEIRSESLHRWIDVGKSVVLPVAVGLVVLYFFCYCIFPALWICIYICFTGCCSCFSSLWRCICGCFRGFCYCCRRGMRMVKMMKAPGRGYMMPRSIFESDPRGYFRGLHAHTDLA